MKSYLKWIKNSKKIVLITHTDSDGICSAVLMHKVLKKLNKDYELKLASTNILGMNSFYKKLPKADLYIFTDLAPDQNWETASKYLNNRIIIFDHHIPKKNLNSEKIIHINTMFKSKKYTPASKIVYDKFKEFLKKSKWVSCVGIYGDLGYLHWKEFFKGQNMSQIKKIDRLIGSAMMFAGEKGAKFAFDSLKNSTKKQIIKNRKLNEWHKKIENYLKKVENDFEKKSWEFGDCIIFEFTPKYKISSALATIVSLKRPDKTIILLNKNGNDIKLNFRRQDGKLNVKKLAEESTRGIGTGGGHSRAAGGMIKREMKHVFIERIKALIKELKNE